MKNRWRKQLAAIVERNRLAGDASFMDAGMAIARAAYRAGFAAGRAGREGKVVVALTPDEVNALLHGIGNFLPPCVDEDEARELFAGPRGLEVAESARAKLRAGVRS